jgi:hypothetical protein
MTLVVVLYINPKTQSSCYYIMFLCKKVFVLLHHVPTQDTSLCVFTACPYARQVSVFLNHVPMQDTSLCVFTACSYARQVSVFLNHVPMQDTSLCVVTSYLYARHSLCVVMSCSHATIYLSSYKVHNA